MNIHSVSLGIWSADIKDVLQKYDLLSKNCVKRYVLNLFFKLAKDGDLRKSS